MLVHRCVRPFTNLLRITGRQRIIKHIPYRLLDCRLRLLLFTPIEHQLLTLQRRQKFLHNLLHFRFIFLRGRYFRLSQ